MRWCSQGLETATKQKLKLSLISMCVKQEVFLYGVALLKVQIDTTLVLASSLVPIWTLLLMSKDNFLTIFMGILTHWRWGFLGKVAFPLANPWRIQRIKPAALIKYELSVIHIFCGKTERLEPIICLLFVCVGSGTGPTSTITPSLMKQARRDLKGEMTTLVRATDKKQRPGISWACQRRNIPANKDGQNLLCSLGWIVIISLLSSETRVYCTHENERDAYRSGKLLISVSWRQMEIALIVA